MYSKEQCELLVNGALANNALIIQAGASECTALSWVLLRKRTIQGKNNSGHFEQGDREKTQGRRKHKVYLMV